MFQLFAEGIEDLYTGLIDKFVRKTPALWDEFVMRLPSGEYYLVDPDPNMPTPTVPSAGNLCLDIHNNVKFSPRLCLWAIDQKLESTGEVFVPGQFAEFCYLTHNHAPLKTRTTSTQLDQRWSSNLWVRSWNYL